jgi:chorismate dehydratase
MTRIATVGYLNAAPLVAGLDPNTYDVVADIPSRVARSLCEGRADVALTPVVSALDDGDFRIVGGVAIGSEGPVHSVVLVAETEPEEWEEIILDGESRTSAVLTRVLLKGPLAERCSVNVIDGEPGVGIDQARGRRAALVIGDAAMSLPDRLTVRLDLGELWTSWTGLPFVFAVWAGRPDLPGSVRRDLRRSAELGLAEIPQRYQGTEREYLEKFIRYELDDRALMGLRRFAGLAHAAGLLKSRDVRLYGPVQTVHERDENLDEALFRVANGEVPSMALLLRCARGVRLADLAAAAALLSERPQWPMPSLCQRLSLSSSPETVAAVLQAGRGNGADVLRLEDLEALEPSEAAMRLSCFPEDSRWVRSLHGETALATLCAAWEMTRSELLDWLAEQGVHHVSGLDARSELGWLHGRRELKVSLTLPVVPEVGLEAIARDAVGLRERLVGLENRVFVTLLPQPMGEESPSAIEAMSAVALCRLGLGEGINLGLSSQRWGLAVSVAALGMGASDLGALVSDETGHLADEEPVAEHLLRLQRELTASGFSDVGSHPSAGTVPRASRV